MIMSVYGSIGSNLPGIFGTVPEYVVPCSGSRKALLDCGSKLDSCTMSRFCTTGSCAGTVGASVVDLSSCGNALMLYYVMGNWDEPTPTYNYLRIMS